MLFPPLNERQQRPALAAEARLLGQGGVRAVARTQVPPQVRARVIALTRMSPPAKSGLPHWSTRTLPGHLKQREGISVSWHYAARIRREENPKPHRSGTFKISKDPASAEKAADVVGLYPAPPGGAVMLSIDDKTRAQFLDRTQPVPPVAFAATEKRTHDHELVTRSCRCVPGQANETLGGHG